MPSKANEFLQSLGPSTLGAEVLDVLPDTMYFVKDRETRYMVVNMPMAKRCGFDSVEAIIGLRAEELFPAPMGTRFTAQDLHVIETGIPVRAELELHLYPQGQEGWCLTWKQPLLDASGQIAGLSGVSRDIAIRDEDGGLQAVSRVLEHIRKYIDQPLHLEELMEISKLSVYQLDRRMRELFGISTAQYITRSRIELARYKLAKTGDSINAVALDCGYSDQSAFTRQFRQMVGVTPKTYRSQFAAKRSESAE